MTTPAVLCQVDLQYAWSSLPLKDDKRAAHQLTVVRHGQRIGYVSGIGWRGEASTLA